MEKTRQQEEKLDESFDFSSLDPEGNNRWVFLLFGYSGSVRAGGLFLWLINPGCCCFRATNVSFNERLFSSRRFYLLMIFIDISISITAGSNSRGVKLGGFPPVKLHYGCSFLYRINHLAR